MEFSVKQGQLEKQRAAAIIVAVYESGRLHGSADKLDKASKGYLSQIIRKGDCEGKIGQALLLHNVPGILAERVLLVGCGKEPQLSDKCYREMLAKTMISLCEAGITDALSLLGEVPVKERDIAFKIRQFIQIAHSTFYRFDELKSKKEGKKRLLKQVTFLVDSRKELNTAQIAVNEGSAIIEGMHILQNLGNLPGNICTPTYLANVAKEFAKKYKKISTAILEEKEMASLKMGSLLSVTQGSNTPGKLITMEYRGSTKNKKPIVLVGKGITFDTGGNSLKGPMNMIGMKFDMCGAATIFGVMHACAQLELPLNIIGVIPTCENMPGPSATRPDDIVTSMSGKTIEILNTDAEGRLILADALTYCERFQPEVVIDIATLTGACVVALGHQASGLMSNYEPLAKALVQAGENSGDRVWELPLWPEYQDSIKSEIADLANIAGPDAGAGTIMAGCFLSQFAEKFHWAHLDIAGTACAYAGPKRGPTGRPVPLLVQYLINCC